MDNKITLFHWNILELPDNQAIFVGLQHRPERDNIQKHDITADILLNYSFRQSTAIQLFDEISGQGVTRSGRQYHCLGLPSDPKNLIRKVVKLKFGLLPCRFRYEFKKDS
jgi:hypothetical protein